MGCPSELGGLPNDNTNTNTDLLLVDFACSCYQWTLFGDERPPLYTTLKYSFSNPNPNLNPYRPETKTSLVTTDEWLLGGACKV